MIKYIRGGLKITNSDAYFPDILGASAYPLGRLIHRKSFAIMSPNDSK